MSKSTKHSFRYLKEEEFDLWDNFVKENKTGTLFHRTGHLRSLAGVLHVNFAILGVYNSDEQLIAGMAFIYNTRLGISNIYIPPFTPYYSPLFKEPDKKYLSKKESYQHKLVKDFFHELSKRFKIIDIILTPDDFDIRPYKWMGFSTDILYTYRIQLDEQLSIDTNYEPDIRRRIKKAQELDFKILQGTQEDLIHKYFDLHLKSYQRQKVSFALNKNQFEDYVSTLTREGSISIYLVTQKSVPVSGVTILYDENNAYYLLAGSDPDYLSTGLNQVLFDYILKDLQKKGCKEYDLVGANTPSIAHYKSTYNFPLVPYYHLFKIVGLKAKVLMKLKNIYEKIKI